MAEDFVVTPWEVTGNIDYDVLMKRFGTEQIDDKLKSRLAKYNDLHYMLRRGIFYSHRDLNILLNDFDKGKKFYIYTGRGPSGNTHLGHIMPWIFNKWIQDTFDVPMIFQMTDDEKFLFKDLTLHQTTSFAYENALDFVALGFDPEKTKIILDTANINKLYPLAIQVSKKITFSTAKAVFGFGNDQSIGKIFFTALESAPAFLPSEIEGEPTHVLIPCGIDQDPHFRVARDVAPGLGYPKPSMLYCKMCPSLSGGDKMSSSEELSTIYTTDTPNQVKKKVGRAFTGGCVSIEEQKEKGGNPDICAVFQYNTYLFEQDDKKLQDLKEKCRRGEIMCGECKVALTQKINVFLEEHQAKREEAKELVDKMTFDGFKWNSHE